MEPSVAVASGLTDQIEEDRIRLRAATAADSDFLHAVFASTRFDEFQNAGWNAKEIDDLLASQFSMQDAYYRRHYPSGRFDVIVHGVTGIGRLYHDWSDDAARVIDIALLPAYRGKGVGTRLMRAIVAEAARRALPVHLYVEFDNPVRALYHRLGFAGVGENGLYERMCREAGPFEVEGPIDSIAGLHDGAE
ncbi:GNAT family N-acetyltransferase [Trinickia fusca]|uniref:GNAT family N-acetyltransferase n=1 Tax=Trinickia fusca TaxID=2419777 RepID=A0A494XBI1_9BURK|nr:GNAT family N-acetyltransferase [Trinickia fusca]RKP48115.1 GNAT family N-acetyltransferase [Trinickia fusca]